MTTEREIEMMGADCYTELALALDGAMHRSAAARAAYKATYGVEWVPLHDAVVAPVHKSHAPSTLAGTVR